MNNDLISREALKKAITEATYNFEQIPIRVDEVMQIIDNAPTVEYTFEEAFQKTVCEQRLYCPKRPQGEWVYNQYDGNANIGNWHCSICHSICYEMKLAHDNFNFCPNCGADMHEGDAE